MAERILVTGATGELGRELVGLLARSGAVVRAATRSPAAARALFPAEVEVVELDFDRTETYDAAAQWVDRIFLMPPPFDPDAYGTINPFLNWAVDADLKHVVLISAMDAESLPELALHKVERHLEALDVGYTILRPNLYMQNFSSGFLAEPIREHGEFELCAGDAKVSFVDARDVAAVAALALQGGVHRGRAYTLTGDEALSFAQVASILSAAAGRDIAYRAIGAERMHEVFRELGWPIRQQAVGTGLFQAVARGRREAVRNDLQEVLGRAPVRFHAFAREHAQAWRERAQDATEREPGGEPVVVDSFAYRHEAEFARETLRAAGIDSMLLADDAGGAYAGLTFSWRARVLVRPEDADRAKQLLADAGRPEVDDPA